MIKISKHAQGTPEWFADRILHMTGSHAQAIGSNGKGLETYAKKVAMEKFCNNLETYKNADMERGNELEPVARTVYELNTGRNVEEVGFLKNSKYPMAGVSLDGQCDDRNIEIKCMNNLNHFNFILTQKIESKWIWQMQMGMMFNGREKCDFIAYNPNFDKDLIVVTVEFDSVMASRINSGLLRGKKLIMDYVKQYNKIK